MGRKSKDHLWILLNDSILDEFYLPQLTHLWWLLVALARHSVQAPSALAYSQLSQFSIPLIVFHLHEPIVLTEEAETDCEFEVVLPRQPCLGCSPLAEFQAEVYVRQTGHPQRHAHTKG